MRFGYVDIYESELLKESFDVKMVPASFYCKDEICYETNALMLNFEGNRKFIEGNYKDVE